MGLRGISMTGWETGTRNTGSGAGYWLFQCQQPSVACSEGIMTNIMDTLVDQWRGNVIRMPICGSGWLQNFHVQGYGGLKKKVPYQDWVDVVVNEATKRGIVVILDN